MDQRARRLPGLDRSPAPTWTHTTYVDRAGRVQVDAYSVEGAPHALGLNDPDWARLAVRFFGLTTARR